MRIPSLTGLLTEALRTFARFPVVLTTAIAVTAAAVVLIQHEGTGQPTFLWKVLHGGSLAFLLLVAAALISERKSLERSGAGGSGSSGSGTGRGIAASLVAILLAAAYAATLPGNLPDSPQYHVMRFFMLAVGLCAAVTVLPYAGRGEAPLSWHFTRIVGIRFGIASVFGAVLFAGFSLALAALDNLFGVDVPGKRYFQLWTMVTGLFIPWFTLGGFPENASDPDPGRTYPKLVKVFAQFILMPILAVYFAILLAFAAKIAVEGEWPDGWVSRLILWYGATGFFMTLLLYPLREAPPGPWVKRAQLFFHASMLPFSVLLFMALSVRLGEYGVTEGRYLAVVLGIWFAGMSLFYLIGKSGDVRVVPATLGLIALASAFGPWSAFSVSERSQTDRLRTILEKYSMLPSGKVAPATAVAAVPLEDQEQISAVLYYLSEVHGFGRIEEWFTASLRDTANEGKFLSAIEVGKLLGIELPSPWAGPDNIRSYRAADSTAVSTEGYGILVRAGRIDAVAGSVSLGDGRRGAASGYEWEANRAADSITVRSAGDGAGEVTDSLVIGLAPLCEALLRDYKAFRQDVPAERLTVTGENSRIKVKLVLNDLRVRNRTETFTDLGYDLQILIAAKK